MRRKIKNLNFHKWYLIPLAIVVLGVGVLLYLMQNPALPAQAADNILRPIFGEKLTLQIESVYFGIGEQVKKAKYSIAAPTDTSFLGDIAVASTKDKNPDNLSLNPIPIEHSFKPLSHEGEWQIIPNSLFPDTAILARTFVRPDPDRSYANVAIVQFDMKKLGINTVAGVRYPGGTSNPGPGKVPNDIQTAQSLVAVFNGGFQERDGHYGMIVAGNTYVPLRNDMAAFLMYRNGTAKFVEYAGQNLDPNVVSIRENGPFLVHNGQITQYVEAGRDTWGRTVTNSMYTWRSGLGMTKEGHLLYAVGGSLVPDTLAKALQMAGAVDAIQLDINPVWVRCFFYTPVSGGGFTFKPLIKNMTQGGSAYLTGYEKDLFYVYKK